MILKWKNRQLAKNKKPHICITASLLGILELGMPAVYLYNGELVRTSAVRSILEERRSVSALKLRTAYTRFPATQRRQMR